MPKGGRARRTAVSLHRGGLPGGLGHDCRGWHPVTLDTRPPDPGFRRISALSTSRHHLYRAFLVPFFWRVHRHDPAELTFPWLDAVRCASGHNDNWPLLYDNISLATARHHACKLRRRRKINWPLGNANLRAAKRHGHRHGLTNRAVDCQAGSYFCPRTLKASGGSRSHTRCAGERHMSAKLADPSTTTVGPA